MARSKTASAAEVAKRNGDVDQAEEPKEREIRPGMILIPAPNIQVVKIKIIGDTSLIVNAFPDKAKKEMVSKREVEQGQEAKNKTKRPARDFRKEYMDSLYPLPDGSGYGFPSIAFKHSIVGACRQIDGLPMTDANRILFVESDMESKGAGVVRIHGEPSMREDVVRLLGRDKPPDIRYRGEFKEWWCDLRIRYVATYIGIPQLYNLIQWAGLTEGVGENRPSSPKKSGEHGMFHPAHDGDEK